ncbi:MAG: restriction endonuclease [Flavobacteriaceae bacterium]
MKDESIIIQKANGDHEKFDVNKLKASLLRSTATEHEADVIVAEILPQLHDGISTKKIYRKAFASLKKHNRISASRYSLKRAILELGPTGFPFERLIGALLSDNGFKTEIGITLQGKCITHEVDVLAEKEGNTYPVECKFHSDPKSVSNVKVPLYINSRFIDIQKHWNTNSAKDTFLKQGWLVTNTRFSTDAIAYAKCVDLNLLSWNYPHENGLKHNIDRFALYPITVLTTLTKHEKKCIIENDTILTKELYAAPHLFDKIGISKIRKKRILNEIKRLCNL